MPAALQERCLVGTRRLLEVHFGEDLVIEFEVLDAFVNHFHESLSVHKVGRSEVFGESVETRGPFRDHCSVAVAIVGDFAAAFAVNCFEGVLALPFVAAAVCVDVDAACFENVDPFVSEGLINEVVGGKEAVDEFVGDGALESVGPLCEEEEGGLYDCEVVGVHDF